MIPESLSHLAVPVDGLRPYGRNPRRGDVAAIRASLETNGQYRPIVVRTGSREVLAGNHTLQAAVELGWSEIAATFVEVDDEQAARIVLVDNRTADLGVYDDADLSALLHSLPDLKGTGWDDAAAAQVFAQTGTPGVDTEPVELPDEPRTRSGDLWALGEHRLICGDATNTADLERLFAGEHADLLVTDPPYGVDYQGDDDPESLRRRNRRSDGKATVLNDRLGDEGTRALVCEALLAALSHLTAGSPFYICAPSGLPELAFRLAVQDAGLELRQVIVWAKDVFAFGRQDYQWRHESVLYGWKGGAARRWFGGRKQDTVWEIPRPKRSDLHPTMKPIELIERAAANSSLPGAIVLDPFAGSGSTLIGCDNLGRRCYALELDAAYCDVIVDRWERHTGGKAVAA